MNNSQTTSRNILIVIAVIVILGIAAMAIGMATLLNDNDVTLTGHHEITPTMFWGMLFGMIMGGIIIIAFFYFLFQLVPRRETHVQDQEAAYTTNRCCLRQ
ncbi:MAG: hypothetical protein ACXV6L_02370 [Halobacteriota archaeon]